MKLREYLRSDIFGLRLVKGGYSWLSLGHNLLQHRGGVHMHHTEKDKASCKLSKGSDWTEDQLKWISDCCHDVWGHDLAIVRSEWKCNLAEDTHSFEMWKMTVRTDQLLHTVEATGSKVHQWEVEAGTDGRTKKLVQLLKQCHTQVYHFYKKGSTRPMIGLHGLHSNNAFQHSNMAASIGLKSFCPWCFKLGETWRLQLPIWGRCTTDWL